ncbi:MAG TPA: hypothetical protein PL169_18970, partial [Leptospiraceae bacterium]|nr:hypothetical protein [Leptospiraceae bacterium]
KSRFSNVKSAITFGNQYNLPESVLSQMTIDSLIQVMGDVTVRAFPNYDEAKKWLMETRK